ncbi:hypothetical protein IWX49DRAFT_576285 [Phyllosticta citricarpa]
MLLLLVSVAVPPLLPSLPLHLPHLFHILHHAHLLHQQRKRKCDVNVPRAVRRSSGGFTPSRRRRRRRARAKMRMRMQSMLMRMVMRLCRCLDGRVSPPLFSFST